MGDEIEKRFFDASDFCTFREKLEAETELLKTRFRDNAFSQRGEMAGFGLQAWLIDKQGNPLPANREFLQQLDKPLVVPELAAFNVELNVSPSRIAGRLFSRLHDELGTNWNACCRTAKGNGRQSANHWYSAYRAAEHVVLTEHVGAGALSFA